MSIGLYADMELDRIVFMTKEELECDAGHVVEEDVCSSKGGERATDQQRSRVTSVPRVSSGARK